MSLRFVVVSFDSDCSDLSVKWFILVYVISQGSRQGGLGKTGGPV